MACSAALSAKNIENYTSPLTCILQYHSTSDAPSTLNTASCDAKLPQNTHLLRLSFCRFSTSGIGTSLTDIRVFSIHGLGISIIPWVIYSCYLQTGSLCCRTPQLASAYAIVSIIHVRSGSGDG